MAKFSKRSLKALEGVDPKMVKLMKASIEDTPVDFMVDQGVRSEATQKKYYSWGRTSLNLNTGPLKNNPLGAIVTMRDGVKKKSNHQIAEDGFGKAVDIYPVKINKEGEYYIDFNDVDSLRLIADHVKLKAKELKIKIKWGGDFKRPFDPPHFELI